MFTKDTPEVTFEIKTEADSPVGKHGLYCQLTIPQNGDAILGRAGNVEFQIDAPLPPTAAPVPAPAPAPAPAAMAQATPEAANAPEPAPPPKPLSRLEKLRLAAQERQAAQGQ
jgi:hypothetical protein